MRTTLILLFVLPLIACLVHAFQQQAIPTATSLSHQKSQVLLRVAPSETWVSSSRKSSSFESFDYLAHWYPVIWARDLVLQEPTKVTVFDVDYVVAKLSDTEVICMEDRCPHKAAALSEGRVTSTGYFQCAYHGWSFNGTTGTCVEIPQLVQSDGTMPAQSLTPRTCGTAIPAQIHQEMVWIFPGGNLQQALLAPPPPSVPEYDDGFKLVAAIRDMPVDWPILVSNICDSDHGLFAHQSVAFDLYSASKEYPYNIEESYRPDGKGWIMKSTTSAQDKLLEVDRSVRSTTENKKANTKPSKSKKKKSPALIATSHLYAPNHLQLKRVNAETGTTNFVAAFYICPVGVGRTRFMSAALSKMALPRWTTKLALDNFLDQDTFLLATQEHHILPKEAEELRSMIRKSVTTPGVKGSDESAASLLYGQPMSTRRKLFCLQSPSERMGSKIEQFWDATLTKVPNRVETLLKLDNAGAFTHAKTREFVLDRETQHLAVCPDAQDTVRNCQRIHKSGKALANILIVAKLLSFLLVERLPLASRINAILKPSWVAATVALSSFASWLASKIVREYFFKYTDSYRRKDMKQIPKKVWIDK